MKCFPPCSYFIKKFTAFHPIKLAHPLLNSDCNQLTYIFIGDGYLRLVSGSGSCIMTL